MSNGTGGLSGLQKAGLLGAIILWAFSWLLIYWHFAVASGATGSGSVPLDVPYFITIGLSVGLVTLFSFASFYVTTNRTSDEAMRAAIAAALVVFYVVLVTDLLVIPGFIASLGEGTPATGEAAAVASFGQGLVTGLSGFVGVVLAFYFAAAAVTDKAKKDNDTKLAVAGTERDAAQTRLQAAQIEAANLTPR